jgi:surfactin synthase thioesterase subunit
MTAGTVVVCLPPSGAGLGYFRNWPTRLHGLRLVPLALPGREQSFRQPAPTTMADAVAGLRRRLAAVDAGQVVVYGHSLGAALAFELARAERGRVTALVVSARQPSDEPSTVVGAVPSRPRELVPLMRRLGAVPEAVFANPDLFGIVARAFRADLRLSLAYRWDGADPLTVPVTAVAYAGDTVVPPAAMAGWSRATSGPCELRVLPGDHGTPAAGPGPLGDLLAAAATVVRSGNAP